jgi:hypothetical protein
MHREKILLIDNVFAPSKKDRILNGVQKFSKAQRDVLSEYYDVYYLTMKGSDIQFQNQIILDCIHDVNLPVKDKRKLTKKISDAIVKVIKEVQPNIVMDNSCKHLTSIYKHYKNGVVFDHYHRPSMPLTPEIKSRFDRRKVYWCGVSKWQHERFGGLFDGTTSVHLVEKEELPVEPKPYAVFVGRWDSGKKPQVMMRMHGKHAPKDFILHVFTTLKHCYIKKEDENNIAALKKYKNIKFHFDAPREEIMKCMREATYILGSGKESTGIVSMEGATFGVPYIVLGSDYVPEQEHMHPFSMALLDRNLDIPTSEQYKAAIERFQKYTLEDRKKIAKYAFVRYNRKQFLINQLRLINDVKAKYAL